MTVKHWNTGLAARAQRDAAQYNLKLKLKKKIQPEVEATSRKRQATSRKLQAASRKQQTLDKIEL